MSTSLDALMVGLDFLETALSSRRSHVLLVAGDDVHAVRDEAPPQTPQAREVAQESRLLAGRWLGCASPAERQAVADALEAESQRRWLDEIGGRP